MALAAAKWSTPGHVQTAHRKSAHVGLVGLLGWLSQPVRRLRAWMSPRGQDCEQHSRRARLRMEFLRMVRSEATAQGFCIVEIQDNDLIDMLLVKQQSRVVVCRGGRRSARQIMELADADAAWMMDGGTHGPTVTCVKR